MGADFSADGLSAQELEAEKQRTLQLEQRISALQQRNTALEQQAAYVKALPISDRLLIRR